MFLGAIGAGVTLGLAWRAWPGAATTGRLLICCGAVATGGAFIWALRQPALLPVAAALLLVGTRLVWLGRDEG